MDANANVSQEDDDGESSLSNDDFDEDNDPSDWESIADDSDQVRTVILIAHLLNFNYRL